MSDTPEVIGDSVMFSFQMPQTYLSPTGWDESKRVGWWKKRRHHTQIIITTRIKMDAAAARLFFLIGRSCFGVSRSALLLLSESS